MMKLLVVISLLTIEAVSFVGSVSFSPHPSIITTIPKSPRLSWYKNLLHLFETYNNNILEEIKYRQFSFYQYHDQIKTKIESAIQRFRQTQIQQRILLEKELNDYITRFQNLTQDLNQQLQERQKIIKELQISQKYNRPKTFDQSLEDFQKAFNESAIIQSFFPSTTPPLPLPLPPTTPNNFSSSLSNLFSLTPTYLQSLLSSSNFVEGDKPEKKIVVQEKQQQQQNKEKRSHWKYPKELSLEFTEFEPFSQQLDKFNDQFILSIEQLKKFSKENSDKSTQFLKKTIEDLIQSKENILLQTKILEKTTMEKFPKALTKTELRKTREIIDKNLEKLEKDSILWLEQRKNELDIIVKGLQEKLKVSDSIYEELLGKKKASIHYTILNDIILKKVLNLIDDKDQGWKLIKSEDGCDVYRKFISGGFGAEYCCVKCTGIVKAPPKAVFDLFEDNTRVKEYNSLFDEGRDLEIVAENTKITWASSTPIFPFKPRDFCTIVHTRKLQDGTYVVLNKAATHPDAPVNSRFVRGSIILEIGANIIRPIKGDPRACVLTMITQVDPGGFAPPMIINHLCALGPLGFMKNIRVAANRAPSKKVLEEKRKIALLQQQQQAAAVSTR